MYYESPNLLHFKIAYNGELLLSELLIARFYSMESEI